MDNNSGLARGMTTIALFGIAAAGLILSPVGAAPSPVTKTKVKKIATKVAKAVFDMRIGTATAGNAERLDGKDSSAFVQSGSAAGGDLTGTYPNPSIATDSVDGAKVEDGSLSGSDFGPAGGWQDIEYLLPFDCRWQNAMGFPNASFYIDHMGIVHLRGRIEVQIGNSCFNSTPITILPAGMRPAGLSEFLVSSGGGTGVIQIDNGGFINAEDGATYLSIDGVTFRAEN